MRQYSLFCSLVKRSACSRLGPVVRRHRGLPWPIDLKHQLERVDLWNAWGSLHRGMSFLQCFFQGLAPLPFFKTCPLE